MHEPRILGHSVHPIIVVSPLCLLSLAVVFDFIHLLGGSVSFAVISYWMMATGLIAGSLTAALWWIDRIALPTGPVSKGSGLAYGVVNTAVLLLYAGSWYTRYNHPGTPELMATIFSTLGAGLGLIGSWLGGEVFDRAPLHLAPDPDALISLNVAMDAPNVTARGAH